MSSEDSIPAARPEPTPRDALEEVLFEVKRVIVADGQRGRGIVAVTFR